MLRAVIYPLLVLTALLLGILVWSAFHPQSWWPQLAAAFSSVTRLSSAKPATPSASAPAPKPAAKESARRRENRPAATPPLETALAAPAAAPAAVRRYSFPLASEIAAGTARAAVLARFGPPYAVVTNADLGLLRERFIYLDPSTGRRTHISLINGNVAEAETLRP